MTNKKHYNSLEDEMSDEMERRATRYSRNNRYWNIALNIFIGLVVAFVAFQFVRTIPAQAQIPVSVSIPCNNANWEYKDSPCQAKPDYDTTFISRDFSDGYLVNGKYWKQTRYTPYLMVYRMEDVCQVHTGYAPWDCNPKDYE